MKINLKNLFMGMAMCSLFLTVSCQEEELNTDKEGVLLGKTTITGMMETPAGTKTELGIPADKVTPVIWSKGDVVKVFSVRGATDFTLTRGAGDSVADFTGELDGVKNVAIYPATATTATSHVDGDEMAVILPEYQDYVANNIATGTYPTIAKVGADGTFAFKNMCGILKLQLTGTVKVTQIVIKSAAVLSGTGNVAISATPTLTMDEGGNNYVVLNCQTAETGMGVQLNATTPTDFYIVVPPTATDTFTLEIASIDGVLQKTTQSNPANAFIRSKIVKMPNLPYVANKVFGGIANNDKYSPTFIGGDWWSPVNAGYTGDAEAGVFYAKGELKTACPEGWILPKTTDLEALLAGGVRNNVVGYYGNGGNKGTWFGKNAGFASVAAPLNCIWSPYTGDSNNAAASTFLYRSIDAASYLLGNLSSQTSGVVMTNLDTDASSPVRCVVITDDSGEFLEVKKHTVTLATASSERTGEGIERSYDGDISTYYHSNWDGGDLPITLIYTLENSVGVDLDYIHYYTRNGNGNFGEVDIYLSTTTNDDAGFGNIAVTRNFGEDAADEKVIFTGTQKGVKYVKFIVKSGTGNFASCAEMEFWKDAIAPPLPGKHVVASASTNSFQPGSGKIENSYDNDLTTTYHSQWILDTDIGVTTRLPLDMIYSLQGDNGVDLDYIHYYTRSGNGTFGEVDIYLSTTTNDAVGFGSIAMTHDFGKDGLHEKVVFPKTQRGIKHVKFTVRTGSGNHATCLEMEFWKEVK